MDAKVGDWVVTPRRGKAVEINALWYNALRSAGGLAARGGDESPPGDGRSCRRARASFNRRFWNADKGGISLTWWTASRATTLLPAQSGLRDLADASGPRPRTLGAGAWTWCGAAADAGGPAFAGAGQPDYKPKYYGDLRSRDAAYHQGTVWAWLIGPFVDAWLKVASRTTAPGAAVPGTASCTIWARRVIGSISEIFDAEPPYTPRGCIAQAWSVAEVLRRWVATADSAQASRGTGFRSCRIMTGSESCPTARKRPSGARLHLLSG